MKIRTRTKCLTVTRLFPASFWLMTLILLLLTSHAFAQHKPVSKGARPPIDLSSVPKDAYEKGIFRIKLEEFAGVLMDGRQVTFSDEGFVKFGLPELDSLNAWHGIKAVNSSFESPALKNGFTERHRKWGFHLWYDVFVDGDTDIISLVQQYKALDEVAFAEPDYKKALIGESPVVHEPGTFFPVPGQAASDGDKMIFPDDPQFDAQWHYHNIGQTGGNFGADIKLPAAWAMETGSPEVIVAIVDGGIAIGHPDLSGNIWEGVGYNFVSHTLNVTPENHGTHVAGTVAAVNNNGVGVSGVAGGWGDQQGISLMSAQVFESTGWGVNSGGFHLAPLYAADNGAAISQNSWGYTSPGFYDQMVLDAIDYFNVNGGGDIMDGGLTIFAAGNSGNSAPYYPAYYEGVIAVAATNHNDQLTPYSTFGHQVDLSAPGGQTNPNMVGGVLSTVMEGSSYGYAYYQGTSMACPHVSGVVALMLSMAPGQLNSQDVTQILLGSTDDISVLNPDHIGQMGTGRLNAHAALMATLLFMADPEAPAAVENLVVDPNPQMELNALLSWTNPTANVMGDPLENIDAVMIYRDDALIHTITDIDVGASMEYTDEEVPQTGTYLYTLRAVNFAGEGIRARASTFVGEDLPGKAQSIELIPAGSNGILSWEHPERGIKGGYYDKSTLFYDIYRFPGNVLVASEYQQDAFFDADLPGVGSYYYKIIAKNQLGEGGHANSPRIAIGGGILLYEDFDIQLGTVPDGWIVEGYGLSNWSTSNYSQAGGEVPEMRFYGQPPFQGTSKLKTYIMDVSGYDDLRLAYKTFVFNLGNVYGTFEISVNYRLDEDENWHQLMTFDDPAADYGPQTDEFFIDLPDGSETLQIAFKWEGNTGNIFDWSIDDVVVEIIGDYYGVFFNITDEDGPPLSGASIAVDGHSAEEVVKGLYFISQMPPGTYDYIIEKEEFYTKEGTLEVIDSDIFTSISMTGFRYDILFQVEDEDGSPIMDAVITLGEHVNDAGEYLFADIRNGVYEYIVQKDGFFSEIDTLEVFGNDVDKTVILELERYSVTFQVFDEAGNEIEGATVELGGIANDPGNYVFENIFPGIYQFLVSKDGYTSTEGELTVDNDDVVQTVELENLISVSNLSNPAFHVYPNPARSVVYIDSEEIIKEIKLLNLSGQLMQRIITDELPVVLNVSDVRTGVYILDVKTDSGPNLIKIQIIK